MDNPWEAKLYTELTIDLERDAEASVQTEFDAVEASISPDEAMQCSFKSDDGADESGLTKGDAAMET